jgi:ABC-type proline/glycine betaine transport system permease subunit
MQIFALKTTSFIENIQFFDHRFASLTLVVASNKILFLVQLFLGFALHHKAEHYCEHCFRIDAEIQYLGRK